MHLQKLIKTIFQVRYVPEDFYKAILRLYQDMHLTTTTTKSRFYMPVISWSNCFINWKFNHEKVGQKLADFIIIPWSSRVQIEMIFVQIVERLWWWENWSRKKKSSTNIFLFLRVKFKTKIYQFFSKSENWPTLLIIDDDNSGSYIKFKGLKC